LIIAGKKNRVFPVAQQFSLPQLCSGLHGEKMKTILTYQWSRLRSFLNHLRECWFFYRFLGRKALMEF